MPETTTSDGVPSPGMSTPSPGILLCLSWGNVTQYSSTAIVDGMAALTAWLKKAATPMR